MATTNDFKNGMTLDLDGVLWNVVDFQHVKPGKGGAFVRSKLKNVLTGQVVDRTFNAGVKVDVATVDKREMTYLYQDGTDYVFMDVDSYEQVHVLAGRGRRREGLPAREHQRHGGDARRRGALRRAPGVGRAHDHLHRAWHAGRPVHRWHQAGHARDRRDRAGAAVRRPGREGQGRHPRRAIHQPRQQLSLAVAARSKARKRALDVLFEADLRGSDPLQTLAEWVERADPPVQEYAQGLVEGVVAHRDRIDEVVEEYAEDWTIDRHAAGRPRGPSTGPVRAAVVRLRSRTRSRSTRPSSLRSRCRPTHRRDSSMACLSKVLRDGVTV